MSLFESFAAKIISDHEIEIFFRVDGIDIALGPDISLAAATSGPGIPEDQRAALTGRYGKTAIWKRERSGGVGQDFHLHIRDVVGGKRDDLATRWSLDDTARRLVDSAALYEQDTDRSARVEKKMFLSFNEAAQARLGAYAIASTGLVVTCKNITLTLFKTGHGFAATTLEFSRLDRGNITAMELLEGQITICRFGVMIWREAHGNASADSPSIPSR